MINIYNPENVKMVEGLNPNTIRKLVFIAERIRRGTYSPEDVKMRLLSLKIPEEMRQAYIWAAANRKPEKPVYPDFKESYLLKAKKPKEEKYAIIAFSNVPEYDNDGNAWHTYWGGNHWNRRFVKSFSEKGIEFTREEKEAYKFKDDHTCDACMAKLIMEHNAFTIALWEKGSMMVHYPGEHWADNGFLIPSFINRNGVNDFYKEGIAFDRRRGWYKKKE